MRARCRLTTLFLHITEQHSPRRSSLSAGKGLKHTAAQKLQFASKDASKAELAPPPLERTHVFASCNPCSLAQSGQPLCLK